jgi:hypothetical protein
MLSHLGLFPCIKNHLKLLPSLQLLLKELKRIWPEAPEDVKGQVEAKWIILTFPFPLSPFPANGSVLS